MNGIYDDFDSPDKETELTDALRRAHELINGDIKNEWSRKDRWVLARIAKGEALQLELDFNSAYDCLENAIAFYGGWEHIGQDPETAYEDFLSMWDSIKHPRSGMVLDLALIEALSSANKHPVKFATWRKVPAYRQFLAVAYYLQQMVNAGECFCVDDALPHILLPVEKLGSLLGKTAVRITDYRRWALADGLLVEVKGYRYSEGLSTVFSFIGEPVSSPSEKQNNQARGNPASGVSARLTIDKLDERQNRRKTVKPNYFPTPDRGLEFETRDQALRAATQGEGPRPHSHPAVHR